ncbi:MAG: hypothetical protein BWK73_14665 [Thiothrix lacustris]|uniref:Uncharacterized protein n=1 Tax=Thiothrix lacustris TaxID=525917 RepID=A0A1Y1QSS3_9GAMM|nr:MAG: hypothetical protein BWK73_14665 [Thiothrix lacustris]
MRYLLLGLTVFVLTLAGKWWLDNRPTTDLPSVGLSLQTPCDLHQAPCVASDAQGRSLRFSINPTNIPLMEELTVQVDTSGLADVNNVRLTVEGVNMFMGYQYAALKSTGATQFQGKLILPVCTLERMEWLATLDVFTADTKLQTKIPFVTISSKALPPFNQDLLEK